MSDLAQTIADYFVTAGGAHHQAYIETDGADPEWPLWYANYMQAKLNELLGQELTQSTIVYHLVHLDKSYRAASPSEPWPLYYANYLINEYNA